MSSAAGFVLTGGHSSRMGRDKALLEIGGTVLVARTAELVRAAAGDALRCPAACLAPENISGPHPLCAAYHRRALPDVASAIKDKRFKMHDLLKLLRVESWPVADAAVLENVNTPLEWGGR